MAQKPASASDAFAIVQQLTSHLHPSRMKEAVETTRDFDLKDSQLMVDLLHTVLEKKHHLLKNPDSALYLLIKIASSARVFAYNRILSKKHLTPDNERSPDIYIIQGDPVIRLKVVRRGKTNTSECYNESLVKWAHLSHPNVLPLHAAFLEGENGPLSLMSPYLTKTNIADHAKKLPQALRMPLILDVIEGLRYLHLLDIVHGGLNPQNVLISENRRAIITGLEAEASETSSARYLAPESMEEEDSQPTKAGDIWSFGCVCYEVLSGNVPFYQLSQERKVATAIAKGKRPTRPGQEGAGGEEINDGIWRPVSACWEFNPEDRPRCIEILNAFSSMDIQDNRQTAMVLTMPERLQTILTSGDIEHARCLMTRILGAEESMPPPSQIPDLLRGQLFGLVGDRAKAEAVAVTVKKLSSDDTQTLVDALDLVVEENTSPLNVRDPIVHLLWKIAGSTHVFPQYYKLDPIRYELSSMVERRIGKVCKGRDFDVCVNVVTDTRRLSLAYNHLTIWARSPCPNIVPLYGVFYDSANEIPHLSLVSPYFTNGTLHEYAPRLPQESRILLLSDVINGIEYLHRMPLLQKDLRGDNIMVSDEGRALITGFGASDIILTPKETPTIRSSGTYSLRFSLSERAKAIAPDFADDIWSFGAVCFEVLSRKAPYHQYATATEIKSALSQGEPLEQPSATDDDTDLINDQFWSLILKCRMLEPGDRPTASEIKELLGNMQIQDDRPKTQGLPGTDILSSRSHPDIKWDRVKQLLSQIQVELLRNPLSKLMENHIKDVAVAAANLDHDDVQTIVDFLDVALKDHLTIPDERNRVLAFLSRTTILTQVFPGRLGLKSVKYDPRPIAEGGFGKVHRGLSDPNICVKVTTRVNDQNALTAYTRELILWAHAEHSNVLPFYGAFFNDFEQICLVSPYMAKGNLRDYATRLPQKTRVPLLLDTVMGLDYLHGLGVVHTDLKGENVLISDEGRALVTDFGASHIITATAKGGSTSASVASTLRFTAPEMVQDETRRVRPTKECDIWSFGCLCYEILSRKLPYYEYSLDAQVFSALFRGQLPRRPGLNINDDDDDWDEIDDKDWDDLDDSVWALIVICLAPKPEDRPSGSRIRELILDMKVWDPRPGWKRIPGVEILRQGLNNDVDLNRVGALLDHLRFLFLIQNIFQYHIQDVVMAISKLSREDANTLTDFWAFALDSYRTSDDERSRLLEIHSAVIAFRQWSTGGYKLEMRPPYRPEAIGDGSFGKVYQGSKMNICVKVTKHAKLDPGFWKQRLKVVASWPHLSHTNVLPFYGQFVGGGSFLVSPFIGNGNLQSYAPSLPQKSRLLPISDVVEGLMYLHKLRIVHGNLKTQNVLISDEGRGLITDFRPYHVNLAAAEKGPTGSFVTDTLRFTAPEVVKNSQMLPTTESDIWSVGCLIYEALSRRVPYYEYEQDSEIRSALYQENLPTRPSLAGDDTDEIDDESWELIGQCCVPGPKGRLKLVDIRNRLGNMDLEDNRPAAKPLPGAEILRYRYPYRAVDIRHAGEILDKLKAHLSAVKRR